MFAGVAPPAAGGLRVQTSRTLFDAVLPSDKPGVACPVLTAAWRLDYSCVCGVGGGSHLHLVLVRLALGSWKGLVGAAVNVCSKGLGG